MKYVKISQEQLNEIEALINSKNETIDKLTASNEELASRYETLLYDFENSDAEHWRHEYVKVKADNEKLNAELDEIEVKQEKDSKELHFTKKKLRKVERYHREVAHELELQKAMNKKAIKMLNEATKYGCVMDEADLSNILDERV